MVLITCLILRLFSLEPQSEQIAFDFFLKEIFSKEYPTNKTLYFSGCTEQKNSLAGPFPKCFESHKELVDYFYKTKPTDVEEIKIKTDVQGEIKLLKNPRAKSLEVAVYRSFEFTDSEYVYITVYKAKEFVDHYIIRITGNKVVDHCKVSEVI